MKKIIIGNNKYLVLEDIVLVARKFASVSMDLSAYKSISQNRSVLDKFIKQRQIIYGINTQFGNDIYKIDENINLKNEKVYLASLEERQKNLIKSHNCGLGEKISNDIVRATMLLRAQALSQGASGVRPIIIQSLINFLNKKISPVIRRFGSVGASGDLIPLSSIAFALISNKIKKYGLKPLQLEAKEGLALINGTSFMTAIAALTLYDITKLFPIMLSALAISLEALLIADSAYNPFVHQLKKHHGQIEVNNFFKKFWRGSKLIDKNSLQDYYSLRSIPQGFGPFYENIKRATNWVENEINSVNDNPIIGTNPPKIYHSANFMGYYITETCDILKIDIAQASSWIHAVFANLIHPRKNKGLPSNLIENQNCNGFKALQILAASLAVQNRKLTLPNQTVMIPTEGDNQDVNSLGTHAAFDLKEVYENLERLTAILLLAGIQAIELRGIGKASKKSKELWKIVRKEVPFLKNDKPLQKDLEKIISLIKEGKF